MGKKDNRRSRKMLRKKAQKKKNLRVRKKILASKAAAPAAVKGKK
jgi:hypothetical protein